ncbi:MAG: LuxR C-terminal-related transcriptional regulator [Lachnospiraceae bacterium]|nr:LuxR C-terminal-related transcriptional regulator [Lachnospiraceae bacterium]
MKGTSNREIAELLHISVRTVGTHLENIYRKHKVSGRMQLAGVMEKDAAKLAFWVKDT